MAVVTKGYSFGATETVTSAKLATLVDSATVGSIVSADLSSNAVTDIKINDVSGAKFTTLGATPAGAGILPVANGGTGQSTLSSAAIALMPYFYPVGTVLTFGVSTNPATLLGFGIWTAIAGRVIFGIDSGQTEFDTLDETGGSKTKTLSASEIPPLPVSLLSANNNSGAGDGEGVVECQLANINSTVSGTSNQANLGVTAAAFSILPPYITKYVWQRTS